MVQNCWNCPALVRAGVLYSGKMRKNSVAGQRTRARSRLHLRRSGHVQLSERIQPGRLTWLTERLSGLDSPDCSDPPGRLSVQEVPTGRQVEWTRTCLRQ